MYVLSVIYLQPLNPKSTASGASLASGPSEGENGRLKIDVTEKARSLLHFSSAFSIPLHQLQQSTSRPTSYHTTGAPVEDLAVIAHRDEAGRETATEREL
jgi:hypothetical protein